MERHAGCSDMAEALQMRKVSSSVRTRTVCPPTMGCMRQGNSKLFRLGEHPLSKRRTLSYNVKQMHECECATEGIASFTACCMVCLVGKDACLGGKLDTIE